VGIIPPDGRRGIRVRTFAATDFPAIAIVADSTMPGKGPHIMKSKNGGLILG